jgi:hypothetical protein
MRALAIVFAGAACVTAAPVPTPIGIGPRYQLRAAPPSVAAGSPVGRFTCARGDATRVETHVELFADKRALLLPTGIGVSRRCTYPLRTEAPTGVVESLPSVHATLGDLFALWGEPLTARGFASFRGRVSAWVGGCPWSGDLRKIPLRRHAEIVVEVGGYIPPHRSFLFPP